MSKKKTQTKLSGKIGVCPEHLSEVRNGGAHLSAEKARKIGDIIGSDPMIWMKGASPADIKKRGEDIIFWCHS